MRLPHEPWYNKPRIWFYYYVIGTFCKVRENFWHWIARHLPKGLMRWAIVHAFAENWDFDDSQVRIDEVYKQIYDWNEER